MEWDSRPFSEELHQVLAGLEPDRISQGLFSPPQHTDYTLYYSELWGQAGGQEIAFAGKRIEVNGGVIEQ